MEIIVNRTAGLPEDAILSIRAGSTRRQAPVKSLCGRPLKFPGTNCNPFLINVLSSVAAKRLLLRPGEENYDVDLESADGKPMAVGFTLREEGATSPDGGQPARPASAPNFDAPVDDGLANNYRGEAYAARQYLEQHDLLNFVQSLLQSVIKDKPKDPYLFMAKQMYTPETKPDSRPTYPEATKEKDTTGAPAPTEKQAPDAKSAEEEKLLEQEAAQRRRASLDAKRKAELEASSKRIADEAAAKRAAERKAQEEARAQRQAKQAGLEAEAQQKAQAEAKKKAAEEEARLEAEAAARRRSGAEARRKAEEEAIKAHQAAEAEARRQAAEAEAQQRRAAAEAQRRAEEAERARQAEAEAQHRRAAAEAQRRAEEQAMQPKRASIAAPEPAPSPDKSKRKLRPAGTLNFDGIRETAVTCLSASLDDGTLRSMLTPTIEVMKERARQGFEASLAAGRLTPQIEDSLTRSAAPSPAPRRW